MGGRTFWFCLSRFIICMAKASTNMFKEKLLKSRPVLCSPFTGFREHLLGMTLFLSLLLLASGFGFLLFFLRQ